MREEVVYLAQVDEKTSITRFRFSGVGIAAFPVAAVLAFGAAVGRYLDVFAVAVIRSEEHTSELQSQR